MPHPQPTASRYEEPAHPRDLGNRPPSHIDAMIRDTIPPTSLPRRRDSFNARPTTPVISASIITEKIRGRSRDVSPRSYHEPRQTSGATSTAPLAPTPPGLPRDTQFVDDYRHHERRVDRDRERHSPTLPRNSSNASLALRSQPSGRYDESGGQLPPRSPELRPTPPVQEQSHHQVSNSPSTRRERLAPPISEPNGTPLRVRGNSTSKKHDSPQERLSRSGPAADTNPPPPPLPVHASREWTPRQPVQPEFMLSLPPPSTRLPGAPPPPVLPPHPYGPPQDSIYVRAPPKDESDSAKVESDPQSPQNKFGPRPTSPIRQTKEGLRPQRAQEGRQEPAQVQPLDNSLRPPVDDGHKENSRYERHKPTLAEERRPNVPSDERQTKPASWDRPRNPHPKPIALPASLPPKPVAALGDLSSIQPSTSLRTGNQGRGRRGQQSSDESSSHNARWGQAPRGDGERNRWGPHGEHRAPPLLARMSTGDALEIHERVGVGESQRKRARTKKYQGV
ncbi:hypothetical protein EDB83DRAFT_1931815 [Lactarius deliciosus]|nr:hypothetical protein EDB83DRAFT_1931815 [Lactarius deliciosus]